MPFARWCGELEWRAPIGSHSGPHNPPTQWTEPAGKILVIRGLAPRRPLIGLTLITARATYVARSSAPSSRPDTEARPQRRPRRRHPRLHPPSAHPQAGSARPAIWPPSLPLRPSVTSFQLSAFSISAFRRQPPVPLPKLLRRFEQPFPQFLRPSRAHASREGSAVLADSCPGLGMNDEHTRSGL